jgi:quercetin dioxygenase-like cupin family protein
MSNLLRNLKNMHMVVHKLTKMKKGWFVGDFNPTLIKTKEVEVAVKHYKKGDREERHHHRKATEITVVVSGKVKMNDTICVAGDIVVISPNESTDFEALEDSVNTIVKFPGAPNDKYIGEFYND